MAVQTQIQVRRGTASSWTSTNPTLAAGELGFETDTGKFKIGTGSGTWTSLAYAGGGQNTLTTYQYTATSGQTTFSGADSNGNTLSYTVGNIQVYLNGVLLVNTAEYTATSGTSIVLGTGAVTGDSLTVTSLGAFTVSSDIPKSTLTAKGSIVTATAGSTPANLSVGANGTVLTADSAEASGLKWATASSGGMTLIETLALTSGSSVTSSTISGDYTDLQIIFRGVLSNNGSAMDVRLNGDTGNNYFGGYIRNDAGTISGAVPGETTWININGATATSAGYRNVYYNEMYIRRYSDSNFKSVFQTQYMGAYPGIYFRYHLWNNTAAITSLTVLCNGGNFTAGNAYIYGVK